MNTTSLPETGYIRQAQLIGRKKSGEQGIIPFSATTLWRMVAAGKFPKPVKLSPGVTGWPVEAIREWMESKNSPELAPK